MRAVNFRVIRQDGQIIGELAVEGQEVQRCTYASEDELRECVARGILTMPGLMVKRVGMRIGTRREA